MEREKKKARSANKRKGHPSKTHQERAEFVVHDFEESLRIEDELRDETNDEANLPPKEDTKKSKKDKKKMTRAERRKKRREDRERRRKEREEKRAKNKKSKDGPSAISIV